MNNLKTQINLLLIIFFLQNLLLIPIFSAEKLKEKQYLTFQISGFSDNAGQGLLLLFKKGNKVPTSPWLIRSFIIRNKQSETALSIPYGEYAAIIVHDKNSNGKIDHKFGLPNEPLGFTNYWKINLFSGKPTFKKLKFNFSKEKSVIRITVKDKIKTFFRH